MKKKSLIPPLLLILIIFSCQKPLEKKASTTGPIIEDPAEVNSGTCGGNFFNMSSGTQYTMYTYPLQLIDISCAAVGATITLNATALDVPNRFDVVDHNNNIIVSSGAGSESYWIGNNCGGPGGSCFGGPWGLTIDPPWYNGSSTFSFTKAAGTIYYLRVQTIYPPNNFSPRTDGWNVYVSCTCSPCGTCPPCSTCVNGVCVPITCPPCYTCVNDICVPVACGGNFYNTSSGTPAALYTYPLQAIDISCAPNGTVITVNATALDVPNRFDIVDQNNNIIVSSGDGSESYWIGNPCGGPGGTCYGGPWGSTIDPPWYNGSSTFTFTKTAGLTYYLKVQTIYPPSNFNPTTDGWNANITCGL